MNIDFLGNKNIFNYKIDYQFKARCSLTGNALFVPLRPIRYEVNNFPIVEMGVHEQFFKSKNHSYNLYVDRHLLYALQVTRKCLKIKYKLDSGAVQFCIRVGNFRLDEGQVLFQVKNKKRNIEVKERFQLPGITKGHRGIDNMFQNEVKSIIIDNCKFQPECNWPAITKRLNSELKIVDKAKQLKYKLEQVTIKALPFPIRYLSTFTDTEAVIMDEKFNVLHRIIYSEVGYIKTVTVKFCHPKAGYKFYLLGGLSYEAKVDSQKHTFSAHSLSYLNQESNIAIPNVFKNQLINGLVFPACCTYFDQRNNCAVAILLGGVKFRQLKSSAEKAIVRLSIFDGNKFEIKAVGELLEPRMNHTSTILRDQIVVYGGYPINDSLLAKEQVKYSQLKFCQKIEFYSLANFTRTKVLEFTNLPKGVNPNLNCFGYIFTVNGEDVIIFYGTNYYNARLFLSFNLSSKKMEKFHKQNFMTFMGERDEEVAISAKRRFKFSNRYVEDKQGYCTPNEADFVYIEKGRIGILRIGFTSKGIMLSR